MASTSSVYGSNSIMPFEENHKSDEQLTIYSATKKSNESMSHAYSYINRIPTTIFRFFTVYGPWEDQTWHYLSLQRELSMMSQ